jgi:hypothetical protein
VYSFAFQLENGVPIIPFYHDAKDEELFHLITYMQGVVQVGDVRDYNREAFNLVRLQDEIGESNAYQRREDVKSVRVAGGGGRDTESEDDGNVRSGVSSESSPARPFEE